MKTEKKVLIGIVTVVLLISSMGAAYFFDSLIVEDNRVTAATLYLAGDTGVIVPFNITNMVPGGNQTRTMNIKNNGTINGNLTASIIAIADPENDLLPPETKAGDKPNFDLGGDAWSGYGEVDNLIQLQFEVNKTIVGSGGLRTGDLFNYTLLPGKTVQLNMTVSWPPAGNSDNAAQSDSVEFDLELVLKQT